MGIGIWVRGELCTNLVLQWTITADQCLVLSKVSKPGVWLAASSSAISYILENECMVRESFPDFSILHRSRVTQHNETDCNQLCLLIWKPFKKYVRVFQTFVSIFLRSSKEKWKADALVRFITWSIGYGFTPFTN